MNLRRRLCLVSARQSFVLDSVGMWGEEAKRISGGGVDFVVEVGGPSTFAQSLKSVKIGGCITAIGFVGGPVAGAGFLVRLFPSWCSSLLHFCSFWSVVVFYGWDAGVKMRG